MTERRVSSSGWFIDYRTGVHEDGRPWRAWHVYLNGQAAFWSPSRELAEQGIRDWNRSGHGVAADSEESR